MTRYYVYVVAYGQVSQPYWVTGLYAKYSDALAEIDHYWPSHGVMKPAHEYPDEFGIGELREHWLARADKMNPVDLVHIMRMRVDVAQLDDLARKELP